MKEKVLFVCIHNSARSQMAEAFLNTLAGDRFAAESAGLEPGKMNPLVTGVMREVGIDFAERQTKSVDSIIARGSHFDYVVTVCDESGAERCPFFLGQPSDCIGLFPTRRVSSARKKKRSPAPEKSGTQSGQRSKNGPGRDSTDIPRAFSSNPRRRNMSQGWW